MFNRRTALHLMAGMAATAATSIRADESKKAQPKIKIGQIGVGHAHASKLSVYRDSPDYEVVGIVEPDPELQKRAATQAPYQGLKWMTQEQLLNTPGLQAVLVETHVRDLLKTAATCISAGKHVHLDKPAGDSLPRYEALLQDAERQQLLVQMGYMYRYNPGVVMLREALKNGWLGDVFEVQTVMSKVVGNGERQRLAEFPGGIMFELGCHVIDLVIGVLGASNKITPFPLHSGAQDDGLMDNMLAVFSYPRATATVKSSALEVDGGERRHFTVCGTLGTFHIQPLDNPSVRATFSKATGPYKAGYQDIKLPKYARYVGDAADMARIIRGESSSKFSYQHDLTVQRSVLAASAVADKS